MPGRVDAEDRGHDVRPDLGRVGTALDRRAAVLGAHRLHVVGVPDPYRDRVAVGEADEPGVAVILCGPGLAGGPRAHLGVRPSAAPDHAVASVSVRDPTYRFWKLRTPK